MPKELLEVKTFHTGTISTPSTSDIPVDTASRSLNIDPSSEGGVLKGIPEDTILQQNKSIYDGSNTDNVEKGNSLDEFEIKKDIPQEGDSYIRYKVLSSASTETSIKFVKPFSFSVPTSQVSSFPNIFTGTFHLFIKIPFRFLNDITKIELKFLDTAGSPQSAILTCTDLFAIIDANIWSDLNFDILTFSTLSDGDIINTNFTYTESAASFDPNQIASVEVILTKQYAQLTGFYFDIDNIKLTRNDIKLKASYMKRLSTGTKSAIVGYDSSNKEINLITDPEKNPYLVTGNEFPMGIDSSSDEINIISNRTNAYIGTGMGPNDKTKWLGQIDFPSFTTPEVDNTFRLLDAELKSTTTMFEEKNVGDEPAALIKVIKLNKQSGRGYGDASGTDEPSGTAIAHNNTTKPHHYSYGISNSGIYIYRINMNQEANPDVLGGETWGEFGPSEITDLNADASVYTAVAGTFQRGLFDIANKKIVSICPSRSEPDSIWILCTDESTGRSAFLYNLNVNKGPADSEWEILSTTGGAYNLDFSGVSPNNWILSKRLIPTDIIHTHSNALDNDKIWVLWTPKSSNLEDSMHTYFAEESETYGEQADRCLFSGTIPASSDGGTITLDDKSPSFGVSGVDENQHEYNYLFSDDTHYHSAHYRYCKQEKDFDPDDATKPGYNGSVFTSEDVVDGLGTYGYHDNDLPAGYNSDTTGTCIVTGIQMGFIKQGFSNDWFTTLHFDGGTLPDFEIPVMSPYKYSLIDLSEQYKSSIAASHPYYNGMPVCDVHHVVGFYAKVQLPPDSEADRRIGWLEKEYGKFEHTDTMAGTEYFAMKGDSRRFRYIDLTDHNVLWVCSDNDNRGIYQRFKIYSHGQYDSTDNINGDGIWNELATLPCSDHPCSKLNFPQGDKEPLKLLFINTEGSNGIANGGQIISVAKDPDDSRVMLTFVANGITYMETHSINQRTCNAENGGDLAISASNSKELRFLNGTWDSSLEVYDNNIYPQRSQQTDGDTILKKERQVFPLADGVDSDGSIINLERGLVLLNNIDYASVPYNNTQPFHWYNISLFASQNTLSIYNANLYRRANRTISNDSYITGNDLHREISGLMLVPTNEQFGSDQPDFDNMRKVLISTSESNFGVVHNPATYGSADNMGFFDISTKYYYKVSLMYDGYQESPLSLRSSYWDSNMNPNGSAGITYGNDTLIFKVTISNVPERVTSINIYRRDGFEAFRIIKSVNVEAAGYSLTEVDGVKYHSFSIEDTGRSQESYEARTGISEAVLRTTINYSLSTEINNHLFVTKCYISETSFPAPSYMFRSKVGNYSQFDWTNDFLVLPMVPTSIAAFQGRIYVWDNNNTYKINPSTLSVEDIFEGVGCIGPEAVSVTDYGMCFASINNVYLHNGTNIIPIGDPILRSSKNPDWSHSYQKGIEQTLRNGDGINVVFYPKRNCFLIFLSDYVNYINEDDLNVIGIIGRVWSYDVSKKRWDRWDAPFTDSVVILSDGRIVLSGIDSTEIIENTSSEGVADLSDPTAYKLIDYLNDKDNNRTWEWNSKDFVLGQSTQDKIFRRIKIDGTSINEVISNPAKESDDIRVYIDGTLSPLNKRENGSWNLDSNIKKGKKCEVAFSGQEGSVDSFGIVFRRRSVK